MQRALLDLPEDTLNYWAYYLGLADIQAWRCTSRANQNFFTDPGLWVQKIANDFHLPANELRSLAFSSDPNVLQLGYKRYSSFLKFANKIDSFKTVSHSKGMHYFIKDKTKQLSIFICCTDHKPSFTQAIDPNDHLCLYFELTLRLGCTQIPQFIYKDACERLPNIMDEEASDMFKEDMLHFSVLMGRFDMVCFLFESKYKFKIPRSILTSAVTSGQVDMLDYFINQHKLVINNKDILLNKAASFGHLDMFKYLLNKGGKINGFTLNCAALSGSIELVQYLINEHKQIPNHYTLSRASESGNNLLCHWLTKNHFESVKPDEINPKKISSHPIFQFSKPAPIGEDDSIKQRNQRLNNAAKYGNLELLKKALLPISLPDGTQAQVFPSQTTLDRAASSGHLEMVQFLLNFTRDNHGNKLKPNVITLDCAINSKNFALVQFLLFPAHRFYTQDNLFFAQAPETLLLNSHQSFMRALRLIKALATDEQKTRKKHAEFFDEQTPTSVEVEIDDFFNMSFESNLEHCTQMFQDVLLHPSSYNLNKNAAESVQILFKILLEDKLKQRQDVKGVVSFGTRIILASAEWLTSHEQQIAEVIEKLDDANRKQSSLRM
jgi:ankyrin repeat protein